MNTHSTHYTSDIAPKGISGKIVDRTPIGAQSVPKLGNWLFVTDDESKAPLGESKVQPDISSTSSPTSSDAYIIARQKGFFRNGKGQGGMDLPPQLSLVPTLTHIFRFQSTNSSLTLIAAGNVLGALGAIGTSALTVATVASSFRIKSLKIWPAAGGTCFVEWAAATGYTRDQVKDASLPSGITVSKSLTFNPPRASFAALWTNEAIPTTNLMNIFAPTGSILDLNVEYTINGVFTPLVITVASAVLNGMYYLALDGPTLHHFPPVGLPTTF
jgi:hypothetical protein